MGIPADIAYERGRRDVAEEILAEAERMRAALSSEDLAPAEASSMIDELDGLWKAIRIADQEFYEELVAQIRADHLKKGKAKLQGNNHDVAGE